MLIESLRDPYGTLSATLCRTLNEPQINAKENYRPAGLRSAVLYFAARRESCEGMSNTQTMETILKSQKALPERGRRLFEL